MMDERAAKRALRIIGALAKAGGRARIEPTNGSVLITLDNGRAMRCAGALLRQMVCAGWLDRTPGDAHGAFGVMLTDDGRSWLNRLRKGGGFAAQHRQERNSADPDCPGVAVNLAESPLARLARMRGHGRSPWLGRSHLLAGERLRSDFEFAQMQPKITASWDPSRTMQSTRGGSNDRTLSERSLDARRRLEAAVEAVGPELSGVLLDVCCFLKGLEQVEAERGWPQRSAKVVLRAALDALDRHYYPPPERARTKLRRWGMADYRPAI